MFAQCLNLMGFLNGNTRGWNCLERPIRVCCEQSHPSNIMEKQHFNSEEPEFNKESQDFGLTESSCSSSLFDKDKYSSPMTNFTRNFMSGVCGPVGLKDCQSGMGDVDTDLCKSWARLQHAAVKFGCMLFRGVESFKLRCHMKESCTSGKVVKSINEAKPEAGGLETTAMPNKSDIKLSQVAAANSRILLFIPLEINTLRLNVLPQFQSSVQESFWDIMLQYYKPDIEKMSGSGSLLPVQKRMMSEFSFMAMACSDKFSQKSGLKVSAKMRMGSEKNGYFLEQENLLKSKDEFNQEQTFCEGSDDDQTSWRELGTGLIVNETGLRCEVSTEGIQCDISLIHLEPALNQSTIIVVNIHDDDDDDFIIFEHDQDSECYDDDDCDDDDDDCDDDDDDDDSDDDDTETEEDDDDDDDIIFCDGPEDNQHHNDYSNTNSWFCNRMGGQKQTCQQQPIAQLSVDLCIDGEEELEQEQKQEINDCDENQSINQLIIDIRSIEEINNEWMKAYEENRSGENIEKTETKKIKKNLKVKFHDDSALTQYFTQANEDIWYQEYYESRYGTWQVDGDRSRMRIKQMESVLGWVLTENHRQKIYRDRFA